MFVIIAGQCCLSGSHSSAQSASTVGVLACIQSEVHEVLTIINPLAKWGCVSSKIDG